MQKEPSILIDRALGGDKQALEALLEGVKDRVYNLSLRMLGSPHDAQDASQEICIRVITGLASFKKESAFSTWVYRVATNHLLGYKKSMFAKMPPLSFEVYGADIEAGFLPAAPALTGGVDENLLAQELKLSCTNVMLQCFDPESRLIYVLGVMFRVDSAVCGEILGITAEAYRQRLSRIRKKMASFLSEYCALAASEKCGCKRRVGYAIQSHRLDPSHLEYSQLEETPHTAAYLRAMEDMDAQSQIFSQMPHYRAPQAVRDFITGLLTSENMATIRAAQWQGGDAQ